MLGYHFLANGIGTHENSVQGRVVDAHGKHINMAIPALFLPCLSIYFLITLLKD